MFQLCIAQGSFRFSVEDASCLKWCEATRVIKPLLYYLILSLALCLICDRSKKASSVAVHVQYVQCNRKHTRSVL